MAVAKLRVQISAEELNLVISAGWAKSRYTVVKSRVLSKSRFVVLM